MAVRMGRVGMASAIILVALALLVLAARWRSRLSALLAVAPLPAAAVTAAMGPLARQRPFSQLAEQAIASGRGARRHQPSAHAASFDARSPGRQQQRRRGGGARLQVDVAALQAQFDAQHGATPLNRVAGPFNPQARHVLKSSVIKARTRGGLRITTLDLLAALLGEATVPGPPHGRHHRRRFPPDRLGDRGCRRLNQEDSPASKRRIN